MSAAIEPRIRFQAQFLHTILGEWWDAGEPQKSPQEAKSCLTSPCRSKTRILKTTTTFEVVEEMEPKS